MPSLRFGLDEVLLRGILHQCSNYPEILEARIYGSRSRGDYKNESDLDIALFGPDLTFRDYLQFRSSLDDLPGLYKFDIIHFDTLENPGLREAILRDGKTFYRRGDTDITGP